MPFMKWSDEFSIGVDELDNDHKKLVGLINELYDAVEAGRGHEALGKILDGLIFYVSYHLSHEEGLFLRAQYPDLEAHKREHAALTDRAKDVYDKFYSAPTETLPHEVLELLKTWLYQHILESDKKFGVYMQNSNNGS